jgi:hypothetical protein
MKMTEEARNLHRAGAEPEVEGGVAGVAQEVQAQNHRPIHPIAPAQHPPWLWPSSSE